MPTIIFSNGIKKIVGYSKASEILQILKGNKEPINKKQADYISLIKDVQFENVKRINKKTTIDKDKINRSQKITNILQNKKLTGKEKAQRIAKIIKST